MQGQIVSKGEGAWLVRTYHGTDPQTHKRIYRSKVIHGSKKAAEKYLATEVLKHDVPVATAGTVSELLDDLVTDYQVNGKSLDWVRGVVRVHLRPFFGAMKPGNVGTDQRNAYITARQKPTVRILAKGKKRNIRAAANGTINRELALLHHAFVLGYNATPRKVSEVPRFGTLKEAAPRKGFFENDEFIAVRRALPEEIRPVTTFGYYTGCRKGEILGLQWNQVDLSECEVRLEPGETKNDEARIIPLVPELREMLRMLKQTRDLYFPESQWVFSRAGEPIRKFDWSWNKACTAAGVPGRLFHDLRRTGVRNLVRAGVPEAVAMKISGHKTRAVFERYNVIDTKDLKDAARKLAHYHDAKIPVPGIPHTTRTPEAENRIV